MKTEKPKSADREDFTARVNALQLAKESLHRNDSSAIPTVRRICQSLKVSVSSDRFPEIATITKTLIETLDDDLAEVLVSTLPRLRDLTKNLQQRHHNILILEDDPLTQRILKDTLQTPNRQLFVTATLADAERLMTENDFSMVLLDLQLPDGDGREFLLKLRERPATSGIPALVISSEEGSTVQTECYALGADVYFKKPFESVTLATAVATKLQMQTEITRRSSTDALTGLPNRRAFSQSFLRATLLAARSGEPLSVAMIDVDRFKSVNDLYGHLTGDHVLRRLASVVRTSLRASDYLSRWGGEEFAVFFPKTDMAEAALALTKALNTFNNETFETLHDHQFKVTFSAGVSEVKPGQTGEESIAAADRVLYVAKSTGRNRVLTAADNMDGFQQRILLVEDDELTGTLVKNFLSRDGYDVIHVKDGEAALRAAKEGALSLITLDMKLPNLNGIELLQRFRQMPGLHQVPIVMLTSSRDQENVVRCFEMGADDYIQKPFSPRELLARVHRLLQR